jgi:hypothetical protein
LVVPDRSEAGALVDLVEMHDGLAGADDLAGGVLHRRPVGGIERALDEVGGGEEILEPLLILDADRLAAELVGDAAGGDIGLALPEDLVARE